MSLFTQICQLAWDAAMITLFGLACLVTIGLFTIIIALLTEKDVSKD